MASLDVYKTRLRRAADQDSADSILFQAAKDPQIGCDEYRSLLAIRRAVHPACGYRASVFLIDEQPKGV